MLKLKEFVLFVVVLFSVIGFFDGVGIPALLLKLFFIGFL
jgi:hypothetical protein